MSRGIESENYRIINGELIRFLLFDQTLLCTFVTILNFQEIISISLQMKRLVLKFSCLDGQRFSAVRVPPQQLQDYTFYQFHDKNTFESHSGM